jgi:hypothetical protein
METLKSPAKCWIVLVLSILSVELFAQTPVPTKTSRAQSPNAKVSKAKKDDLTKREATQIKAHKQPVAVTTTTRKAPPRRLTTEERESIKTPPHQEKTPKAAVMKPAKKTGDK